jgi:hypothetical protein
MTISMKRAQARYWAEAHDRICALKPRLESRGNVEYQKSSCFRVLKLINNCPVSKAFGTGYRDKTK